jgi:hypothetical protein
VVLSERLVAGRNRVEAVLQDLDEKEELEELQDLDVGPEEEGLRRPGGKGASGPEERTPAVGVPRVCQHDSKCGPGPGQASRLGFRSVTFTWNAVRPDY